MVAGQVIGQRAGSVENIRFGGNDNAGFFHAGEIRRGGIEDQDRLILLVDNRIQRHLVVPGALGVRIPPHHLILKQGKLGALGGLTIIIPLMANGKPDGQA